MTRTIKFRGKSIYNGRWVEGDLVRHYENQRRFIAQEQMAYTYSMCGIDRLVSERYCEIDPESVGQYTGLNDKNGKEIYEDDICTANWYDYEEPNHTTTGVIEFCEGWIAYWLADYESETFEELNGHGCYCWDIEVIGNIYENPELLEVQQ